MGRDSVTLAIVLRPLALAATVAAIAWALWWFSGGLRRSTLPVAERGPERDDSGD